MTDLLKMTIDGQELEVAKGTTILNAARTLGIDIPTFCFHPGLSSPANCRMCLVNTNKAPKLLPACYATCMDGMEVTTNDEKTVRTRKATLEFILLHHPVDCPICDQAGECVLQDNYFAHSASPSRLFTRKGHKPKATPIGPNIMLDAERCIVCTRCVRFCEEITGTGELGVVHRGERSFVTTFPGRQVDNDYATNVADICPVGALTSRDFRFKMRVWFLKTADSVCSGCSRGCNIYVDHGGDAVQRYRPRENADVNQWWMCDPGRLSYKEFETDRLLQSRIGGAEHPARQAMGRAARLIKGHAAGAGSIAVVPSLRMTNEDLAALMAVAERLGLGAFYEGGAAPGKEDKLLQKADKNPNRKGLQDALAVAGKTAKPLSSLPQDISSGAVSGVLWLGHEHEAQPGLADALGRLSLRIVMATNESEWTQGADVLLPARTFEEVAGHWTNFEGRVQAIAAGPQAKGTSQAFGELLLLLARTLGHMDITRATGAGAGV